MMFVISFRNSDLQQIRIGFALVGEQSSAILSTRMPHGSYHGVLDSVCQFNYVPDRESFVTPGPAASP